MAIVNGYVRGRPAKSLTESWCTKKKWFDKKMERAINLIHSYPGHMFFINGKGIYYRLKIVDKKQYKNISLNTEAELKEFKVMNAILGDKPII